MTAMVAAGLAYDDGYRLDRSGLYLPSEAPRRRLRGADIFAGCGGFSLGMQSGGIDVVAAVEWDDAAAFTYLYNLGSVRGCAVNYVSEKDQQRFARQLKRNRRSVEGWVGKNNHDRDGSGCRAFVFGDASKVTGDTIRATLAAIGDDPRIDVVFGGPPCQGMSTAGRQNPADPRNNLVLEFVRLADELEADVFVMENVPPLLKQRKFRPLLDSLVERALAAGFEVVANVLNACDYGVPQIRHRAFIVGTRGGASDRPFHFPLPSHWSFGAKAKQRWSFLERDDDDDSESSVADQGGQGDLFPEEV